jgi:hypothetical protein
LSIEWLEIPRSLIEAGAVFSRWSRIDESRILLFRLSVVLGGRRVCTTASERKPKEHKVQSPKYQKSVHSFTWKKWV